MQREPLAGNGRSAIWSPDGWLVYQSDREGDAGIWQSPRGGSPERLTRAAPGESHTPESWSAKAGVLLFTITKGADVSLWTIAPPWKDPQPFADVHSIYPIGARFSPDGRWIAYTVREPSATGTVVYVRPFPATATRYPLPGRGPNFNAHKPAWSTDGTELFYVPRISEFEVMPIMTRPTFEFGNPVVVPRPFAPGGPNALPLCRRCAGWPFHRARPSGPVRSVHPPALAHTRRTQLDRRAETARFHALTSARENR